jgi:hypothetical protein
MSGAILPLPQYAFMVRCSVKIKVTGTTLPFFTFLGDFWRQVTSVSSTFFPHLLAACDHSSEFESRSRT